MAELINQQSVVVARPTHQPFARVMLYEKARQLLGHDIENYPQETGDSIVGATFTVR